VSTSDEDRASRLAAMQAAAWEEAQPRIMDRLAVLHAAAAAARDGGMSAELRREAESEAHKLSGSLGMFGLPDGSVIAHDIEELLEGDGPVDGFPDLVDQLTEVLPTT
jgi:HPt (histidine-containing phosphotransfer) domain-containing protein